MTFYFYLITIFTISITNKSINIMKIIFSTLLSLLCYSFISAQVSAPLPFLAKSKPLSARITDYEYKDTIDAPSALVRLPNGKIGYMIRQEGKMVPFFIKAIETGYWDTRYEKDTDYDTIFADMRQMGANTAYVMLHWEDIEPADNHFDFTFADAVAEAAQRQNLKVGWILFLHAQQNGVPSFTPETAWTFHLDDRDSSNYTMQWVKRNGRKYTNIKDVSKYGIRPLHVYGHNEIFYRIRRMLYQLATHYRKNETVIGVQLGNEEGFSFLDESDFNPVTAGLYEEWKLKTNKTDYAQFKKEAMDWWWQQFTSAFHEGDPYKILSFNLDAAQAEAGDEKRVSMTGTSAATYADGNLDAIGTMLYKGWGYRALLGLDKYYGNSYNYRLPVLIPSEIGIGNFNSPVYFRHFVAHSLERGAQGFGVYCYGEVRKELPEKKTERKVLTGMLRKIRRNEDILFAGLPGAGYACCSTDSADVQLSHLNVNNRETLVILYFPKAKSMEEIVKTEVEINCKVHEKGNYQINIYSAGDESRQINVTLKQNETTKLWLPQFDKKEVAFIRIVKQ